MRDDVRALAADLSLHCGNKLGLIRKLLLSESDKRHYEASGNLEKVIEIAHGDTAIIDSINIIDFDIARVETELAAIIGVARGDLYRHLSADRDAADLIGLRNMIRCETGRLLREREALSDRLESDSRNIAASIRELSRIDGLKQWGPDGMPPSE